MVSVEESEYKLHQNLKLMLSIMFVNTMGKYDEKSSSGHYKDWKNPIRTIFILRIKVCGKCLTYLGTLNCLDQK